jgi:hypothetical protein
MAEYESDPDWRGHITDLKRGLLDRTSAAVLEDVLRGCPVSQDGSNGNPPGYLRDHQRRAIDGDTARVGSDVDYSVWVEDGHRVAYRKLVLEDGRWLPHGEKVFTGAVVPPQPFLRTALNRKRDLR